MPDVHVDAGGADTFEHRMLAKVGARHDVAHLGQGDGDGTHARAADADDVQPVRDREIERRLRGAPTTGTGAIERATSIGAVGGRWRGRGRHDGDRC